MVDVLREYVAGVLNESPWDAAEQKARERYEAAVAELAAWDEASQAFQADTDKWHEDVRRWAAGDRKTRGRKPERPKVSNYPILVRNKKREKLQAVVDKEREIYGHYDPAVIGYVRQRQVKPRLDHGAKPPDKDKPVHADFDACKPTHWYAWPRRELMNSGSPYKSEVLGVGPGEDWFAWLFGGQVQGDQVSFDIVLPSGERWELKALENASSTFRTGTEGLEATAYARGRLGDIMRQLKKFVELVIEFDLERKLPAEQASMVNFVLVFVEEEFKNIVEKGEIAQARLRDLRRTTVTAYRLKKMRARELADRVDDVDRIVSLNNDEFRVTVPTFIDIARRVQRDVQRMNPTRKVGVLDEYDEIDVALTVLNDSVFENPRWFWTDYFKMIQVEDVFQQVEGLVIINPLGFMKIPKGLLREALELKGLTMGGKPYYGLKIFGAGPKGAPPPPTVKAQDQIYSEPPEVSDWPKEKRPSAA